ncbi:MAG: hypothetical protein QUS14_01565, partial [Pyrinomonadaceae bacterium]|nr:hypothetical protein [Pyrinomonadaceae bacterium]
MHKTALILTITALLSIPALAQFPQMKRAEERMEQLRKADEERQKSQDAEDIAAIAVPKPKAAVMNVDVQSVLVKQDARSFAEAKPNAVKDVADGDPLWLYVKFNGKLGDYVHTVRDKENGGQFRYLLYLETGPKGDITALTRYVLEFSKSELEQTELKINLAPGIPGKNAASPALIEVAGTRSPGAWGNELRLANTTAVPRLPTDNLAVSEFTFNFQRNFSKYPKMRQDFTSMMLRGTTNASVLPPVSYTHLRAHETALCISYA